MKTHTTTTLQKLVLELMSPQQPAMTSEQITDWSSRLPEIFDEMKLTMGFMLFGAFSRKLLSRHFQQITKECTLMLDTLYLYTDPPDTARAFYGRVVGYLEEIIWFQQARYEKFLDFHAMMPLKLYCEAARRIEEKAPVLVTAMGRYYTDKTLQALVIGKMTGLLQRGNGSWHQVNYLVALQDAILGMCSGRTDNISNNLRKLLIEWDFNTEGFINYCQHTISEEVAQHFVFRDQYECLCEWQWEMSKPVAKNASRFDRDHRSVKGELTAYLTAEVAKMDRMSRQFEKAETATTGSQLAQPGRLSVSISVDSLAYFFNLLVKAGVVNGSKNDLVVFLSKSFKTPGAGAGAISMKSLDNKYRQVVTSTTVAVRSILIKMLNQIDNEYGK